MNTLILILAFINTSFLIALIIGLISLCNVANKQEEKLSDLENRVEELKKELENRKQEIEKQKKMIRLASGEL